MCVSVSVRVCVCVYVNQSFKVKITPLVIYGLGGGHTHTHTHTSYGSYHQTGMYMYLFIKLTYLRLLVHVCIANCYSEAWYHIIAEGSKVTFQHKCSMTFLLPSIHASTYTVLEIYLHLQY